MSIRTLSDSNVIRLHAPHILVQISDQDKGLEGAITEEVPRANQFLCERHRCAPPQHCPNRIPKPT